MAGVGFYSLFVSFEGKLQVIVCSARDFVPKAPLPRLLIPEELGTAKSAKVEE